MPMTCRVCGGSVQPKAEKLKVVLGGTGALIVIGAMLGTPIGWFSLIPLAWAGSANANNMLRLKAKLWQASQQAGCYLQCSRCGRDVPLSEVL